MNILLIAKQVFAYSNWMNKARSKIENLILKDLTNSNFKYYTLLLSDTYYQTYYRLNFRDKNFEYSQLNDQQKQAFNGMVQNILNELQKKISSITKQLNEKTWILKNFINENYIPSQDDEKFEQVLSLFNHYKRKEKMIKKDIKQYSSYSELYNEVSKFLIRQNVFEFANKECDKICSAASFTCYKVDNFQQGKILFNQTGWCVKGSGYFHSYGPPYYIVFEGDKRYALIHLDSQQCKDINDDPINPENTGPYFFTMLAELFDKQNNSQFLNENDFQGYEPFYINWCEDHIENLIDFICDFIDNATFEKILEVLDDLNKHNKLQSTLSAHNNKVRIYLDDALKAGEPDDYDYRQLIYFLVSNEVKLYYPDMVMYMILEKDDVDLWISLNKCNQNYDIPYDYDQYIIGTNDIFRHEIENGFTVSLYDFDKIIGILQERTDMIDSVEGAEKFLDIMRYDSATQLKQICQNCFDELYLTQQQQDYLWQYYQKVAKKEAFNQLPDLPGLYDKK